jgi:hypothetical protein
LTFLNAALKEEKTINQEFIAVNDPTNIWNLFMCWNMGCREMLEGYMIDSTSIQHTTRILLS